MVAVSVEEIKDVCIVVEKEKKNPKSRWPLMREGMMCFSSS